MNRLVGGLIALALSLALVSAACGGEDAPADSPAPSEAPVASGNGLTYIALGDSLSAGSGASTPSETAFVPLVHESLGDAYTLNNLGHAGDTSADLLNHGHLDEAIEAASAQGDEVALVTLEIGGNDLLGLYFGLVLPGTCPDVTAALAKEECTEPLAAVLAAFETNLSEALDRLLEADPSLRPLLMTFYDPFSGFLPAWSGVADLALEGVAGSEISEGLNDIIRQEADLRGLPVADVYEPFQDRASELLSGDFIHPNDAGYRVMADAVIATLKD